MIRFGNEVCRVVVSKQTQLPTGSVNRTAFEMLACGTEPAPPSRSIDVTMMLQTRAKQMKITCEVVPHRILMTSR